LKAETKAENVIEEDGFVKKTVEKRRFKNAGTGHGAPAELGEGARGVGGYRHGAPTELMTPFRPRRRPQIKLQHEMNRLPQNYWQIIIVAGGKK